MDVAVVVRRRCLLEYWDGIGKLPQPHVHGSYFCGNTLARQVTYNSRLSRRQWPDPYKEESLSKDISSV
jgi:hypothetical protein